jgi:hypothetical protein
MVLSELADALELARSIRARSAPGNVWHDRDAGGALSWAFEGKRRIWIDERADLFAAAGISLQHPKILGAYGAYLDLLERHHVELVVAPPSSAIVDALRCRRWRCVAETPTLLLLERP